jgi:hypothetical protein
MNHRSWVGSQGFVRLRRKKTRSWQIIERVSVGSVLSALGRGGTPRSVGGDVIEYKVGIPRNQIYLFQNSLEELIEQDNVVRFIDVYVESLDMGKLEFRMHENRKGAPAYRPQVKLKIYIYGYL